MQSSFKFSGLAFAIFGFFVGVRWGIDDWLSILAVIGFSLLCQRFHLAPIIPPSQKTKKKPSSGFLSFSLFLSFFLCLQYTAREREMGLGDCTIRCWILRLKTEPLFLGRPEPEDVGPQNNATRIQSAHIRNSRNLCRTNLVQTRPFTDSDLLVYKLANNNATWVVKTNLKLSIGTCISNYGIRY